MPAHIAWTLAALVLAGSVAIELTVRGFGFPDGHRTELERAYAELWRVGMLLSVLLALNFAALGVIGRRRRVTVWAWASIAALLLLLAFGLWSGVELRGRLSDGGGG